MNQKVLRVYELPAKEYQLVQAVRNHPHLGTYAATELKCVLGKSLVRFSNSLVSGQEKLIRDLAQRHDVKLPC